MLAILSPKGGSWSQAFHAWTAETGDESAVAIRKHQNLHNAVLYEDHSAKTDALYAHAVRGRPRSKMMLSVFVFEMGHSMKSLA